MEYPKFKIGQVANLFGITSETSRYYERKGVISAAEKSNTYRYYDMTATGEIYLGGNGHLLLRDGCFLSQVRQEYIMRCQRSVRIVVFIFRRAGEF